VGNATKENGDEENQPKNQDEDTDQFRLAHEGIVKPALVIAEMHWAVGA
jgi:hypothetical protein